MRNIIGPPARGEDFYPRDSEIKKIRRSLDSGNHSQIAAPRRVGKTSILMYFLDTEQDGDYFFVYVDVEATKSESDFYKKLYESILKSEVLTKRGRLIQQLKTGSNSFIRKIKGVNLLEGGLELNHDIQLDYNKELSLLIKGLDFNGKKLVLMIDEFPYAINNLIDDNGSDNAKNLLKSKRTLRLDPEISKRAQFIYTGSISLNTTVENINASELVNDIDSVRISELNEEDAKNLIRELIKEEDFQIDDKIISKMVDKVGWLIPFHLQLFVKELISLVDAGNTKIDEELIDRAFNEIVDFRNNNYFEHYLSRLKKLFKGSSYNLTIDILETACKSNGISKSEVFNLASKHDLEHEFRKVIHSLIYDGYLFLDQDQETYIFNSPILKSWWKSYVL